MRLQRIQHSQNFESLIKLKKEAGIETQVLDERQKKVCIRKLFNLQSREH